MKAGNVEALIDYLLSYMGLKNDAALAKILKVAPPVISKLRNNRLPLGASMLLRMHDATDLSIANLRKVAGHQSPLVDR